MEDEVHRVCKYNHLDFICFVILCRCGNSSFLVKITSWTNYHMKWSVQSICTWNIHEHYDPGWRVPGKLQKKKIQCTSPGNFSYEVFPSSNWLYLQYHSSKTLHWKYRISYIISNGGHILLNTARPPLDKWVSYDSMFRFERDSMHTCKHKEKGYTYPTVDAGIYPTFHLWDIAMSRGSVRISVLESSPNGNQV